MSSHSLASLEVALTCCVIALVGAWPASASETRELSFYHTHTERVLTVEYYRDGAYVENALVEVDAYLADFRNGETKRVDPALLDLLYEIKTRTGTRKPFEVISAYRSPETNEMLRRAGRGVAKRSMHLVGKAIDVRLEDVPLKKLHEIALALKRGGVGYYSKANFVHVDTGRVRRW